MTAKIDYSFVYPKSSCPCEDCTGKTYLKEEGVPTNIGIHDCDIDEPYYDCYNYKPFKNQIEPANKPSSMRAMLSPEKGNHPDHPDYSTNFSPSYILNSIQSAQNSQGFFPIECSNKCSDNNAPISATSSNKNINRQDGCPPVTWVSNDARLLDVPRNSLLQLDRPPYNSGMFLHKDPYTKENSMKIYDEKYKNYGQCYSDYSDITAGDIYYYVDKSREDAYYEPNFTIPMQTNGFVFKDPMDNFKPVYKREVNKFPDETYSKLSWIRDSAFHREDIMAGQMAVANQQRYEPRYTNNFQ